MKVQATRVIAGSAKRLPSKTLDGLDTRPTTDRIKETLFNMISPEIYDSVFLDLFAGSGALGFEAASRGAQHVLMVEKHPKAVAALRQFRDKHKLAQVRINDHDARLALKRMDNSRFDLILIDPPFADEDLLKDTSAALPSICKNGTLVYVESATPFELPEQFELLRQDKAGASHFYLYYYNSESKV